MDSYLPVGPLLARVCTYIHIKTIQTVCTTEFIHTCSKFAHLGFQGSLCSISWSAWINTAMPATVKRSVVFISCSPRCTCSSNET